MLDAGVVTEVEITQAQERAKSADETLAQALLWYSFISDEELGRLVADHFHFPFVVVSEKIILPEVVQLVPEVVAQKQQLSLRNTISRTPSLSLYNGSTKVGVINTLETELKAEFPELTVMAKEKALKNDYVGTLVIDLSGKQADLANTLAGG